MIIESENRLIIPRNVINIAPSKMFTYPTRLASSWEAGIMEINLPGYQRNTDDIEVTVRQDSTQSLGLQPRNILKRIYKNRAASIRMDEEYIFDSRYETDGNIAHIIGCVAAKLFVAQKICPKITVILKANPTNMALNVYKLLGFPVLCTNRNVQGKLVLISSTQDGDYEPLYRSFFGELAFEGYNKQTPERVFISRKGARSLINEQEVERTLKAYGFEKFYYEDIPISEQWSITRNAKVVVAMHGAALSSLAFNRNAVKVLELFHPGYVVNCYRHYTSAIGGTWCGVTGELPENIIKELDIKKNARSFALSRTKIDTTSLRMALDYLGVEKT